MPNLVPPACYILYHTHDIKPNTHLASLCMQEKMKEEFGKEQEKMRDEHEKELQELKVL